jgi:hypothetical protein
MRADQMRSAASAFAPIGTGVAAFVVEDFHAALAGYRERARGLYPVT